MQWIASRQVAAAALRALLLCAAILVVAAPSAAAAKGEVQPRIVGGAPADAPALPSTVAIVRHERDGGSDLGRQFCGGSLVSSRVVITAAHCVQGRSPADIQVIAGRADLNSNEGATIDVAAAVAYPLFSERTYGNDVALLALAAPSEQPPLPIATTADAALWQPWTSTLVAGWGSMREGGPISPVLQSAGLSILPNKTCSRPAAYGAEYVSAEMLCAGRLDASADACTGDSGGPLLSSGILIGLVSWGRGCARPGLPGVYTRLGNPSINSWTRAAIAALEAGQTSARAPRTVVHERPRRRSALHFAAPGAPWAAFQCSLGRSRYRPCTPRPGLRQASRVLRVRAMNLFGGVDPTPVRVRLASMAR
jgi:trypsin